jgi:alkylation response protein AidB-like acyl-CoA dehydrogenase
VEFGLTEEQALLRDTVRDLVARTCPPEVAKAWDDDATPPTELQRVLAGMELFGLPFPVEFGGAGASPTELVIVAEELGHASLDVAMCYSGRLIPTLGI